MNPAAVVSFGAAVVGAGVLGVLLLMCFTLGAIAAHVIFVALIEEVTKPDVRRYPLGDWFGYLVQAVVGFGIGCSCLFMGAVVVAKNWGSW